MYPKEQEDHGCGNSRGSFCIYAEPVTDLGGICKNQLTGGGRYMISGKYLRTTAMLSIMVLLSGLTACGVQKNTDETTSVAEDISIAEDTSIAEEHSRETLIAESETAVTEELQDEVPAEPAKSQTMEYTDLQQITLDPDWEYADHSKINTGAAVLYRAPEESGRKGIVIGVNAGHGTAGGAKVKTLCHPDGSAKVTGGSTAAGATEATAVSGGMTFQDGTPEREVTLRMAQILRDKLLSSGYDVLMLRDGEDVQLDNVARTVICNHVADCHISLHWDGGDGKNYDKGCFYISVPEALKSMDPVASHWQQHDNLGTDLVEGLREQGATIYGKGHMGIDLTQTSYSTIPSVDMELGNAYSDHSDVVLEQLATGLLAGINTYFEQ